METAGSWATDPRRPAEVDRRCWLIFTAWLLLSPFVSLCGLGLGVVGVGADGSDRYGGGVLIACYGPWVLMPPIFVLMVGLSVRRRPRTWVPCVGLSSAVVSFIRGWILTRTW